MIALLTLVGSTMLSCTVSSEGGISGMVRQSDTPVVFDIRADGFSASGHSDLERLKEPTVERRDDNILLLANYEDLPTARLVVTLGSDARRIEWNVVDATGTAGQEVLASHAVGTCKPDLKGKVQ